jgi:hypothetical protein
LQCAIRDAARRAGIFGHTISLAFRNGKHTAGMLLASFIHPRIKGVFGAKHPKPERFHPCNSSAMHNLQAALSNVQLQC